MKETQGEDVRRDGGQHYSEVPLFQLRYKHVEGWFKDNPVDKENIEKMTAEHMKDVLTRSAIKKDARAAQMDAALRSWVDSSPGNQKWYATLEQRYADRDPSEIKRLLKNDVITQMKADGVALPRIKDSNDISREMIAKYRSDRPDHAEWLSKKSREELVTAVGYERMCETCRVNSPAAMELFRKVAEACPDAVKAILERFKNENEPFRSIKVNMATRDVAERKGIARN